MAKVKIGKKNYNVRSTVRALFIFEKITGKNFSIDSTLDNYIYIYSVLLACNPEMDLTWDAFIDELDKDPNILIKLNKSLSKENAVDEVYTKSDDKEEAEGKKE